MAMQIGSAGGGEDQAIAAINTTPLVDVMLVLLIIFLITIPVVNYSVPVELPKQRSEVRDSSPDTVVITVDAHGALYWLDARIAGSADLRKRLKAVAAQKPQPAIHIRGDFRSDYEPVGQVMLACQLAGISKVGFITEPQGTL